MQPENLATGFREVDGSADPGSYSKFLEYINTLPSTARYKNRSFELLALVPGCRVLDAGCGRGDDVIALAQRVGASGEVVGVDNSKTMLAAARSNAFASKVPVRFEWADIYALPYKDGEFDRVRIDRVLQHLTSPEAALRELTRVLKPGGVLVAIEPHWPSFVLHSDLPDIVRAVLEHLYSSFANVSAGGTLADQCRTVGLEGILEELDILEVRDYAVANEVYELERCAHQAADAGKISRQAAELLIGELSARRDFCCALERHLVAGIRPLAGRGDILCDSGHVLE